MWRDGDLRAALRYGGEYSVGGVLWRGRDAGSFGAQIEPVTLRVGVAGELSMVFASGAHEAWADCGYANALATQLSVQAFREAGQGKLCGRVGQHVGNCEFAANGRDVHHHRATAPALRRGLRKQSRQGCPGGVERGEEVHAHGVLEDLGGEGLDGTDVDDAGVVDEHIDTSEAGKGLGDHALTLGRLRQVRGYEIEVFGAQMWMPLEQCVLRFKELVEAARGEYKVDGPLGETGGDLEAKATGAARNEHHGALRRRRGEQGAGHGDERGGHSDGCGDDGNGASWRTAHARWMHLPLASESGARYAHCHGNKAQILMATRRKSKGAYMISSVAEMYDIHPQTLRLYEREGLLRPSRSEGNTRLYTDEDLERLEFILNLARDLGVNIAGIAIVLQMRERMEEMNRQMQGFVEYVRTEMLTRMQQAQNQPSAGLVPMRRPVAMPAREGSPAAKGKVRTR